MTLNLSPTDQLLLNAIQTAIPLTPRPFQTLGQSLNLSESQVLEHLTNLKSGTKKIIRQISAIFDSKSLGYQSTLVAAKIDPAHLDHAVSVINAHPGVSHNYLRNHDFNLWYTLAVPPDSSLGLDNTLAILHQNSRALSTRKLPTLKLFKIGVKFDLSGEDAPPLETRNSKPETSFTQSDRDSSQAILPSDIPLIRILQQDLPLTPTPFDAWAAQAHVSTPELLAAAGRFLHHKQMRRFSAVLRHREAGISANAMGVWAVPDAQIDSFGTTAASFPAVSHCYLRQSHPDWPYTLFTMVHAPSQAQCEQALAAISKATGITHYAALYSCKEFKKTRVQYFTPATPAWEAAHTQTAPPAAAAATGQ